jgi:hypothetical protein
VASRPKPSGRFHGFGILYLFRERWKKEREREEKRRKKGVRAFVVFHAGCVTFVLPFIPSPHAF